MKIFALEPLDLMIFSELFPQSLLHDVPAGAFLVGCADGEPLKPAGVLIAHVEQRSVIVDWIYVDESCRRRGAGRESSLFCRFRMAPFRTAVMFSQPAREAISSSGVGPSP